MQQGSCGWDTVPCDIMIMQPVVTGLSDEAQEEVPSSQEHCLSVCPVLAGAPPGLTMAAWS